MSLPYEHKLIERAKKLLDLIEKAMGKKVADRGAENTINQFGSSLEYHSMTSV